MCDMFQNFIRNVINFLPEQNIAVGFKGNMILSNLSFCINVMVAVQKTVSFCKRNGIPKILRQFNDVKM